MKTISLGLLASVLLIVGSGAPSLSQTVKEPATDFHGFACEIDVSVLPGGITLPNGTTSVVTFTSRRLCAGSASRRNIKLECERNIPDWNSGDLSDTTFDCFINGDTCGLPGFKKSQQQSLTVSAAGKAKLTCFFKP